MELGIEVLETAEVALGAGHSVSQVRKLIVTTANSIKMREIKLTKLATAGSEIARNVLVHAKDGVAVVQHIRRRGRDGVCVTVSDRGPGIPDLEVAMGDGFTTAKGLGLGLGGSRRLVDEFDVDTDSNGTSIRMISWV